MLKGHLPRVMYNITKHTGIRSKRTCSKNNEDVPRSTLAELEYLGQHEREDAVLQHVAFRLGCAVGVRERPEPADFF